MMFLLFSAPVQAARTHVVQPGDTLSGLCQRYYANMRFWPELQMYNGIKDANLLQPGSTLLIPHKNVVIAIDHARDQAQRDEIILLAKGNDGFLPAVSIPGAGTSGNAGGPAANPQSRDPKNPREVNYDLIKGTDNEL